ncbi:hypothetical protein DFS34DRAFT_653348 [Phlyctochytrium arcticum]|nr:hypothetical protein DFS34DRAFT_653348 [Phlyctochytrium arcticum]
MGLENNINTCFISVKAALCICLILSVFQPASYAIPNSDDYRYYCNLSSYPPLPTLPISNNKSHNLFLAAQLASAPSAQGGILLNTSYTHISSINGKTGQIHTDCSCFISYLLNSVGLHDWFNDVPKEMNDPAVDPPMPRAVDFAKFFRSLEGSEGRWERVRRLQDMGPGDLIGWLIPNRVADTGHTLIAIGHPISTLPPSSYFLSPDHHPLMYQDLSSSFPRQVQMAKAAWIPVADSSRTRHELDSHCSDSSNDLNDMPCHRWGVGQGRILLLEVNNDIVAFQFHRNATVRFYDIGVARVRTAYNYRALR